MIDGGRISSSKGMTGVSVVHRIFSVDRLISGG